MIRSLFVSLLFISVAQAQLPIIPAKTVEQTQVPVFKNSLESTELANFRLNLNYTSEKAATLRVTEDVAVNLPAGKHLVDLTYEHAAGKPGLIAAVIDGTSVLKSDQKAGVAGGDSFQSDDPKLRCDRDYTVAATFKTKGQGSIFSKSSPKGKWSEHGKVLYIRGNKLVYDIGWVGAMSGGPRVNDDKEHRVVVTLRGGNAELFLDGKSIAKKGNFAIPDVKGHVFKIGKCSADFGKDFEGGSISNLRYWDRALEGGELKAALAGNYDSTTPPELTWASSTARETFGGIGYPGMPTQLKIEADGDFKVTKAWVQPLGLAAHGDLISKVDKETLETGKQIYQALCITCHGTPEKEGTLPTALKFHEAEFKNGSDPFRMYQTLTKGYGLMVPQPQYSAEQKYAVIHYIRETFVKPNNPKQYFQPDATYLASLPKKLETVTEAPMSLDIGDKPYQKMDFGPALMWTYQVNRDGKPNIAQKGIAVRLDQGPGGVSKGRAWMVYDEDTMRIATAYTGAFADWRGIAFDGSHGTHTSIAGTPLFINPDAPAWQHPKNGGWEDERIVGRDGRRFGPLPRDWVHYKGKVVHGTHVLIKYTVGDTEILEMPGLIDYGSMPVFTRTLNVGKSAVDLVHNLTPSDDTVSIAVRGPKNVQVVREAEAVQLKIPAAATPAKILIAMSNLDQANLDGLAPDPIDLTPLTKGGPARFEQRVVTTEGKLGDESDAFAVDTITIPNKGDNPWASWMRLGGFDFFPDNPDRAAVCTWLGDVWLVDGVAGDLKELKWRRICSGLFQPLGLKIVDGKIYVTCRDQIARLHDYNGDEEIDYIESFNNDHQVTEHFHEFAMGLQVDDKGNFYYAKSARHAKTALVPHHGTLLRVTPDGKRTDIVAVGFRAANGVCLNPDGTWIVTDQEGHWNPKNRINYVREGGFYGNMYGYHDIEDSSDEAMEQPLAWITNAKDRSPAELLWVPENNDWGNLSGTLLNLSYGYGMIYTVPHEIIDGQAQGGICEFPIARQPTGLHRGRFHPKNKQLYAAGMFAWAGSQRADGGFYRIRATGKPAYLPTKLEAKKGTLTITFSDPLPEGGDFAAKTWDLKRTKNYGSKHYNEKTVEVKAAKVSGNTVTLSIPDLQPTWGMEVRCKLGNGTERVIHNSIHRVN